MCRIPGKTSVMLGILSGMTLLRGLVPSMTSVGRLMRGMMIHGGLGLRTGPNFATTSLTTSNFKRHFEPSTGTPDSHANFSRQGVRCDGR